MKMVSVLLEYYRKMSLKMLENRALNISCRFCTSLVARVTSRPTGFFVKKDMALLDVNVSEQDKMLVRSASGNKMIAVRIYILFIQLSGPRPENNSSLSSIKLNDHAISKKE